MIRSLRNETPAHAQQADVCIVGAGAAGIVLAVELARQNKKVLLLEGGGKGIEDDAQTIYQSEITGLPHRGIHVGRFRAHGGTTLKWGGQILPLDAEDFEQRSWVEGSGWPFQRNELLPFYESALHLEGLKDVECEDTEVWKKLGEQTPSFPGMNPYFTRWTPEPNFARLHRETLEGHSVDVWLHANAIKLDIQCDLVRGVTCRTLEGVEHTFQADEYVFCLGAIESSRFFLQPRENDLPWNQSGLLGKHFQDHIDANVARIDIKDAQRFHALFDNVYLNGLKYHPKLRVDPQIQRERQLLNVAATMYFQTSIDEKLANLKSTAKKVLRGKLSEVSGGDITQLLGNIPLLARQVYRYSVQHRVYSPPDATVFLRAHCEQEPLGASSITLSSQQDALGLYRTQLNWQISDFELHTIRELVKVASEALRSVANLVPDDALMAGDPSFRSRCDDSNHHMGGMRMDASPSNGVVDPDLKLHGTRNCYVGSSAVFPTSGFSNPTHTLLALMVRLADHLARR